MVRFTHNDFEVSVLGNGDRNRLLHVTHEKTREFLVVSGIAKPEDLRGDERLAPGALTISKLGRKFLEDKVTGFEMRMMYPIVARTDGVEVKYGFKEAEGDEFSRRVKVRVLTPTINGDREMPAMIGSVYLHKQGSVDIPEGFYQDPKNTLLGDTSKRRTLDTVLIGDKHYVVNQQFGEEFPDDFFFDEDVLRRFCQSAGVPLYKYNEKFGDAMSPMIAAYLMVDPMVHYAECVSDENEALARKALEVDKEVELGKIQLYMRSTMCSTDATEVNLNNYVDVYVCRGDISCKVNNSRRDTSGYKKAICDCLFFMLMVNREDSRPIAAGTFNAAEQYFIKPGSL